MTLDVSLASDLFAKREVATHRLREFTERRQGKKLDDPARAYEDMLFGEIAQYDGEIRALVVDAAHAERMAPHADKIAAFEAGAVRPSDPVEHRGIGDMRVLGMRLDELSEGGFVERSADALDALDTGNWQSAPIMLAEAPNGSQLISRVQAFTHNSTRGYIPVVPQLQASITGRNDELQPNSIVRALIGTFETVKVAAMVKAPRDHFEDYPQMDASTDAAILGALGAGVDDVLVNGGTDGDVTVTGLVDSGTETAAAVTVASVLSAIARIKTARATPDTILMHPDTEAAFLGAIDGALLAKLPEIVAIPSVPADAAIVAALGNIGVAMRENLGIARFWKHADLFKLDQVAIAGRARLSSVVVPNVAHVQIVKPAA